MCPRVLGKSIITAMAMVLISLYCTQLSLACSALRHASILPNSQTLSSVGEGNLSPLSCSCYGGSPFLTPGFFRQEKIQAADEVRAEVGRKMQLRLLYFLSAFLCEGLYL